MTSNAMVQNPISVSVCDPQLHPGSSGRSTWTPGFYPVAGRPFGFRDPFGRTFYQPPISASATLFMDYRNATETTMTSIVFGLVAREHLVAEIKDVGTFSPGVKIQRRFGLSPNVFPLGTGLPQCVPLYIEFEGGKTWRNPRMPSASHMFYPPAH